MEDLTMRGLKDGKWVPPEVSQAVVDKYPTPPSQSPNHVVVSTIIEQLGGSKFRAMTGAKDFSSSGNNVSFRIGQNAKAVRSVKVTLDANDTYTMTFYGNKGTVKYRVSGVYNDNLQSVFTQHTGLDTHL